jgi:molybdopterin converting factor small subunit
MAILVKFFGDLRYQIKDHKVDGMLPLNIELESNGIDTISDILERFSIGKETTGHIFVNASYAGFNKKVRDGDRVGIFPKSNMSLLYKWYFTRKED